MDAIIRKAKLSDFRSVVHLNPDPTDYIHSTYYKICHDKDAHHFVVEYDSKIVGYVLTTYLNDDGCYGYLNSAARVAPEYRGKNISSLLYDVKFSVGDETSEFVAIVHKSDFHRNKVENGPFKLTYKWDRRRYNTSSLELCKLIRENSGRDVIMDVLTPANVDKYLDTFYQSMESLINKNTNNILNHGFPKVPLSVSRNNLRRVSMVSRVCCSQKGGIFTGISLRDILKVPGGFRCDIHFYGSDTDICLAHVIDQLRSLTTPSHDNIIVTLRLPIEMKDRVEKIDKVMNSTLVNSIETWVIQRPHKNIVSKY